MAHRAVKQPQVSVVLAVHDSERHLVRAMESVLAQEGCDVELVAVACDATDAVSSTLERYRDRDIRVEVVAIDSDALDSGFRAGMEAARGSHLMLLRVNDWLAPQTLSRMYVQAAANDADVVLPARLLEPTDAEGESGRRAGGASAATWLDATSFRKVVPTLAREGVLSEVWGALLRRGDACCATPLSLRHDPWGFSILAEALRDAGCVCYEAEALVHCGEAILNANAAFDTELYVCVKHRHTALLELIASWGGGDAASMKPIHTRYILDIIQCIDNASLGAGGVSSIERIGRVQDMLDDEETVASLAAVGEHSREFGVMYKSMCKRNAAGCCMGSRIRALARISHLPVGPVL